MELEHLELYDFTSVRASATKACGRGSQAHQNSR